MTVYLPERLLCPIFFPGNLYPLKPATQLPSKNRGVPNGFPALNLIARFVATESIANDKIIITVQVDEGSRTVSKPGPGGFTQTSLGFPAQERHNDL